MTSTVWHNCSAAKVDNIKYNNQIWLYILYATSPTSKTNLGNSFNARQKTVLITNLVKPA